MSQGFGFLDPRIDFLCLRKASFPVIAHTTKAPPETESYYRGNELKGKSHDAIIGILVCSC